MFRAGFLQDLSRNLKAESDGPPLAQRAERRPKLGREELGLFPGGEVPACVDLVEVGEVGVGHLDPAARGPEDLIRKGGKADWHRDRWW